ncbi:MAG TPA: AMP-binding protein, partial [Anaerolineales bacterium]|nr:AMP-binding protein [Anaerolineales bacterium]
MKNQFWFKYYDKGVPSTLAPYPERTLIDVLSESARMRPQHPALLFQGNAISYGELDGLSAAFGRALIELAVKPGDRVALLLPNSPQFILSMFGAWKAGAIIVPLNPLYTERELEHALCECGAVAVVVLTPFYDKLKAIQSHTSVRKVIATNIKEFLPATKRMLFTLLKEKKDGHRIALQAGDVWFADLLRRYRVTTRLSYQTKPTDPAILLFSGGTTGVPKAAVGLHHSLFIAG